MSFDEWFLSEGMDCYGNNSEEYKVSLKTWNYQQTKIDKLEYALTSCLELAHTQLKIMQELSK